jgi:hypothetical protein
VTDCERVKLLFGPYKAPPLKRGDRALCRFRESLVVIAGWADASLPAAELGLVPFSGCARIPRS